MGALGDMVKEALDSNNVFGKGVELFEISNVEQ